MFSLFYFRFPWWFGTLSASILTIVCISLLFYRYRIGYLRNALLYMLVLVAVVFHFLMLFFEINVDIKNLCEIVVAGEPLLDLLCWWSNPLWWAVLRDGLYFIIVICSIISLQFHHGPSFISVLFDDQLLDSPLILNRRRQRTRRERRSSFVIHYVLLRTGHIRRRRRVRGSQLFLNERLRIRYRLVE